MRVLVAEDEPLAREAVTSRLAAEPDVQVVAECHSGDEVAPAVQKHRPDVLFLDVQMPEMNGFEALAALPEPPPIVFVTAFREFAIQAFEIEAVDYLLKPIDDLRFQSALSRVRHRLQGHESNAPMERLIVRLGQHSRVVSVDEIEWIEAADYYSRLHFTTGRSALFRESLGTLMRKLDARAFFRAHRSAILRFDAIAELRTRFGENLVVLKSGTAVRLSRAGRRQLRERLKSGAGNG